MNKQFIYFTSIMFLLMAAGLAVSAQESNGALDNATINNITINASLNETISPVNKTLPALNETVPQVNETLPALNETVPQVNETLPALNETVPQVNETLPALNETVPQVNETLPALNETVPQVNETLPALNETLPALNETEALNSTARAAPESSVSPASSAKSPMQIGTSSGSVFSVGGGASYGAYQIGGSAAGAKTFEVGIPIKPVRDVSKMFFSCHLI